MINGVDAACRKIARYAGREGLAERWVATDQCLDLIRQSQALLQVIKKAMESFL
jgi:hypothetical protein